MVSTTPNSVTVSVPAAPAGYDPTTMNYTLGVFDGSGTRTSYQSFGPGIGDAYPAGAMVTLTGLSPNTDYDVTAEIWDVYGQTTFSTQTPFTTPPPPPLPGVDPPSVVSTTPNSVTVSVPAAPAGYDPTTMNYTLGVFDGSGTRTSYQSFGPGIGDAYPAGAMVTLTGLSPNTDYDVTAEIWDVYGQTTFSTQTPFTTPPPPPLPGVDPPSVVSTTPNSVTVSVPAAPAGYDPTTMNYTLGVFDGSGTRTSYQSFGPGIGDAYPAGAMVTLTGLSPNTDYDVTAEIWDVYGQTTFSTQTPFTTPPPPPLPGVDPPSVVSTTPNSVTVSVPAAPAGYDPTTMNYTLGVFDGSGTRTSYQSFGPGIGDAYPAGAMVTLTGLSPNTDYDVTAEIWDVYGQTTFSTQTPFTTPPPPPLPGVDPPSVVSTTPNSVTVSVPAAPAGYDPTTMNYTLGVFDGSGTRTSYQSFGPGIGDAYPAGAMVTLTGLSPNTDYDVTAEIWDVYGQTTFSTQTPFTTPPPPPLPGVDPPSVVSTTPNSVTVSVPAAPAGYDPTTMNYTLGVFDGSGTRTSYQSFGPGIGDAYPAGAMVTLTGLSPNTDYDVTAEIWDVYGQTTFSTQTPFTTPPPPPLPFLSVVTATLPGASIGRDYSASLVASGGTVPYTWSVSAGSLPNGLTLDPTTGAISGTPTTVGVSNFNVAVTDSASPTPNAATKALSIVAVKATPTLTVAPARLPATSGPVSYTVAVTGASGTPTGSVTIVDGQGGSCLVSPLSSGGGSCAIVEDAGSSPYTITATYSGDSSYSTESTVLSIVIVKATPTLTVAPAPLPATSGPVSYSVAVTGASGTPTGSVTIVDGQGGSCLVSPLSSGGGSCAIVEDAGSSPYTITATYSGDSSYSTESTVLSVASSVSSGGVASAGSGGLTATARGGTDGVDTVTATAYPSDPVGAPSFISSGGYFDVVLSSSSSFTSGTITDCDPNVGDTLQWWDPSANADTGGWVPVVGDPGPTYTASSPPCLSVTLDNTSSPILAQLTGTVFGVEATVPDAPRAVSAVPGHGRVTLQWTKPLTDGGKPITGYVVKPYLAGIAQPGRTFETTTTNEVITGLTNGKKYTFTVTAKNLVGTGHRSTATTAVRVGAPTEPTKVVAAAGPKKAVLRWTKPKSDGGTAITGYVVTPYLAGIAQPGRTFDTTATDEVITGLAEGKKYTFKVAARNAFGVGLQSAASTAVRTGAPTAPTDVVAIAGPKRVTLRWAKPAA